MSATLILILFPVLALLTVAGVGYAFVGPSTASTNAKKRLQSVKQGAAVSSSQNKAQQKERDRRKTVQKTLNDLEQKQKEEKARISLSTRIEQAGFKFSPVVFWLGSAGFAIFGFVMLLFSGVHVSVAIGGGLAAGIGLPRWLLGYMRGRRQRTFLTEFSNALDVIVRGVKAGLPLSECLNIVARESPDPVGGEFRRVVEGARVGVTLEEGLFRMYERMPMDINRGDRFDYLSSMSSPALGRQLYAKREFPADHIRNQAKYICGDMNTSLIKTARGRTIMVQHDTTTPRPYTRHNLIQGTNGVYGQYPDRFALESEGEFHEWQHDMSGLQARYDHELWKRTEEGAEALGGHGGMDYVMLWRTIYCLRNSLPLDQNVYDAAAWSVVIPLSEASNADRGNSKDFPDFTRGTWKTDSLL